MAFHEVRFPDNISRGARGGPERRTQIVELASGAEERNASWTNSRRRYDVAYGIRRADDLAAVVAFFEARNGRLHGFRFSSFFGAATLTSSTTSVLYTAAQQTADWGALLGPGQSLAIRNFQLSNRLGRGTPATVTLQF